MYWGEGEVTSSPEDQGILAKTSTRLFAIASVNGELQYFAGDEQECEGYDFELGVFATLAEGLTLAEAYLVRGVALQEIDVPRRVRLAELPAKPGSPVPRLKFMGEYLARLAAAEPSRARLWLTSRPRVILNLILAPLRGLFTGYAGCLSIPLMLVFVAPCILLAGHLLPERIRRPWLWAIPIGLLAAVVATFLGVLVFGFYAMWQHTRKRN